MIALNSKALVGPVGIIRILEVIFSCITFSLVAAGGHISHSFWVWCMFTWCFCCCVTIIILFLEFTCLNLLVPISWDDFIAAFAMLATLMGLAAAIIFSALFPCATCYRYIIASVTCFVVFILYAVEVGLTRARRGEISGFLTTVPGLLKILEAFVACVIFICLDNQQFSKFPGLQWCVAVYSICFIFAIVVIIFTICRILALLPVPFDKVLTGCNMLAVLMYMTAVVIWPFYSFKEERPNSCTPAIACKWNNYVVISFMTCVNLVAYIVDTVYSFRLVFFVSRT